ncbi:MAG: iron-sulfur cluster insertion protein ErpA [Bdellovibrionales bacterium]|nr:iron-sulfur cluster insertion protein ErpA [Bdellovibrionales bacterium]
MTIQLTENAVKKVKNFQTTSPENASKVFRVYVEGGGCSGFQYGFSFDEARENDHIMNFNDVKVVVDPFSAPYIQSSTIDYIESLMNSGFVVTNPNSKSTCGCGLSFNV